jgi:predicted MFS family arabinose efflux permease
MKASTLKLCLPVIAITTQNNVGALIIPPFLHDLNFSVATIGSLISLGPVLALLSRIPAGVAYKKSRARALISIAMIAMAACNFLYSLAADAFSFALVHGANGFAYGAVTTLYMAFYVDSLAPDENRNHAMGYYVGCLAAGYSIGNFLAGYIADHFGYDVTFVAAALLSVVGILPVWILRESAGEGKATEKKAGQAKLGLGTLRAILEPKMAGVVIVALFLNALHQVGNVFLPLYGLAVGMTLTQVGVIRAFYSLCNAITRPLSGFVVNRLGHRKLSYGGLPLQSASLMLVPLFTDFGAVLAVFIFAGFMRAVAIVSNAVSLVQDVDETKVHRGVATGIYNAAGDLGNILGPSAGGLIASVTGIAGLFVVAPLGATALFFVSIGVLQLRAKKSR